MRTQLILRNPAVVSIFFLVLSAGCTRNKLLVGEHPTELVGNWKLLVRSSCDKYGVMADTLLFYSDGRFDQHVSMNDGRKFDLSAQRWSYDASDGHGHISLDKRLEFFRPEFPASRNAAGVFEDLLMEYRSEPVIILNPDSDCVYVKQ